jgi:hypothetical protein
MTESDDTHAHLLTVGLPGIATQIDVALSPDFKSARPSCLLNGQRWCECSDGGGKDAKEGQLHGSR